MKHIYSEMNIEQLHNYIAEQTAQHDKVRLELQELQQINNRANSMLEDDMNRTQLIAKCSVLNAKYWDEVKVTKKQKAKIAELQRELGLLPKVGRPKKVKPAGFVKRDSKGNRLMVSASGYELPEDATLKLRGDVEVKFTDLGAAAVRMLILTSKSGVKGKDKKLKLEKSWNYRVCKLLREFNVDGDYAIREDEDGNEVKFRMTRAVRNYIKTTKELIESGALRGDFDEDEREVDDFEDGECNWDYY